MAATMDLKLAVKMALRMAAEMAARLAARMAATMAVRMGSDWAVGKVLKLVCKLAEKSVSLTAGSKVLNSADSTVVVLVLQQVDERVALMVAMLASCNSDTPLQ